MSHQNYSCSPGGVFPSLAECGMSSYYSGSFRNHHHLLHCYYCFPASRGRTWAVRVPPITFSADAAATIRCSTAASTAPVHHLSYQTHCCSFVPRAVSFAGPCRNYCCCGDGWTRRSSCLAGDDACCCYRRAAVGGGGSRLNGAAGGIFHCCYCYYCRWKQIEGDSLGDYSRRHAARMFVAFAADRHLGVCLANLLQIYRLLQRNSVDPPIC